MIKLAEYKGRNVNTVVYERDGWTILEQEHSNGTTIVKYRNAGNIEPEAMITVMVSLIKYSGHCVNSSFVIPEALVNLFLDRFKIVK